MEEINKIIENEETDLKSYIKEKEALDNKWFQLSGTLRYIEFLDFYLKEKKEFIEKIKKWETH